MEYIKMSHFTSLKTKISDVEILIKILDKMKLNWYKPVKTEYDKEKKLSNIIIKQKNGYDISFSKKSDFYELVYDEMFWQQPISTLAFTNKINYLYSLNLVTKNLSKEGYIFNINKEETNYNNIKLKLNALRFR
jgi:hypothetical protein